MRASMLSMLLVAMVATVAAAAPDEMVPWLPLDHPEVLELVAELKAVDAYTVPDLELAVDPHYAGTPADVLPFGGVKPYYEHFLEQMEYTGPGRAKPEPVEVQAVKLGFLGPIEPTVSVATGGASHEESLGIPMLKGARLAVEHWNARGGHLGRGVPFELVVRNDNGLWGSSGNEIIDLAYTEGVWAILGTIDGANSHIAIRVALKAEIVIMNSADTDPTFIETNIPWVFRAISDDRQQSYLLVDFVYRKLGVQRLGVIRSSNRYGRFGVREIRDSARRIGRPIPVEMAYEIGQTDFDLELERLRRAGVEAVVHWGDAIEGGLILRRMRELGMEQPFFCCDRCLSDEFLEAAGEAAEGVVCASPWSPQRDDPRLESFRRAYVERWGETPGTYAAHAYDGMNMLIWATQVAGLNRARIRDVLAHMPEPWPGVTGRIDLSACLDDSNGEVYLARRDEGRWEYRSREELGVPSGPPPTRRTEVPGPGVGGP